MNTNEVIKWARVNVKEPWFKLVNIAHTLSKKEEELSTSDCISKIMLTPIKTDLRNIIYFLQGILIEIMGENPNLWTIITNETGDKIIWSCLESADINFGCYTQLKQIDIENSNWINNAQNLIIDRDLPQLYTYLKEVGLNQYSIVPGVIKIANIKFFEKFKEVYELYEKDNDLLLYFLRCFPTVKEIFEKEWLIIYPEKNIFKQLKTLVTEFSPIDDPLLTRELYSHILPEFDYAFTLRLLNYQIVLRVKYKKGKLSIDILDQDKAKKLDSSGFRVLASNTYKNLFNEEPNVIAYKYDSLKQLLIEFINTLLPYDKKKSYTILAKFLFFIRSYGKIWNVFPEPPILIRRARDLFRSLGIRYSINNLAYWFIPDFIYSGIALGGAGWSSNIAIFILDKKILLGAFSIYMYDGAIRQIKCINTEDIKQYFKTDQLDNIPEILKRVKLALWKKSKGTWFDIVMGVQKDYIKETLDGILNYDSKTANYNFLVQQITLKKKIVMYPEIPLWKLYKKLGTRKFFSLLVRELFDTPNNAVLLDHGKHLQIS